MQSLSLSKLTAHVTQTLAACEADLQQGVPLYQAFERLGETQALLTADTRVGAHHLLTMVERTIERLSVEVERTNRLYEAMYTAACETQGEQTNPRMPAQLMKIDAPIVGIDEVGRGPLAGPLTVAAVILPRHPQVLYLNDSKKLRPTKREEVAARIAECAEGIAIVHIEPQIIDDIGILNALRMGMRRAVQQLNLPEQHTILIDGNPIRAFADERCIVQGDAKIASIAAASIVAKVARDALMVDYDQEFPGYTFAQSKGYGSAEHIAALKAKGFTPIHRRSFCKSIQMTE